MTPTRIDPLPALEFHPSLWLPECHEPEDEPCIFNDWCIDELVKTGRPAQEDDDIFKVGMRARIRRVMDTGIVLVARLQPEFFIKNPSIPPDRTIAGWGAFGRDEDTDHPIIHFLYVKARFRRHHIATHLAAYFGVIGETGAWATHQRSRLFPAMKKYNILYNKYLLEGVSDV